MSNMSFKISSGFTHIYNWFIDNYMVENPTYSMVYIYALRLVTEGKECSNSIIADKLDIFESDVVKAWKFWHKKGVIAINKNEIEFLDISNNKKDIKLTKDTYYNPSDIEKIAEKDNNFDELVHTIENLVGRTLSHNNINIIANMYDKMGLPFEVIILLVQYYCGRGKGLAYIEKVAISWCERGINTMELAEQEINSYNIYSKIIRFFGVTGRSYTEREKKYMEVWINNYKFSLDIIKLACERTISNTGKVSLSYTEKILASWYTKGVKSVEDVKKLDERHEPKPVVKPNTPKNVFTNYTQKVYTDEEIEEIIRRKANN